MDNPFINEVTDAAASMIKTTVTAHGGDERDFDAIVADLQGTIEAARDDAEVAVDVT